MPGWHSAAGTLAGDHGGNGEAHRTLVRSAAEAGFTTLRVWGGGIYEPDAFCEM